MTEIQPALTADEWKQRAKLLGEKGWDGAFASIDIRGEVVVASEDGEYSVTIEAELLPATMALANAALPDDDPRKITREDVHLLLSYAVTYASPVGAPLLAAKLAALLPREG